MTDLSRSVTDLNLDAIEACASRDREGASPEDTIALVARVRAADAFADRAREALYHTGETLNNCCAPGCRSIWTYKTSPSLAAPCYCAQHGGKEAADSRARRAEARVEKAEARVRELEAELAKANRDPLCASCLKDWCQRNGTDVGDEDEDVYLASCTACGRDME